MKKPTSHTALYVHWPWCRKKCPYCDFNSHVAASIPEEDYVSALLAEMAQQAQEIQHNPLISIFFGGGTPSLMQAKSVEKILVVAQQTFGFADKIEITLEANPTSSSFEKFEAFAQAGVNRFSVGVQSFDDDILKFLGREHSARDAAKTVEAAQQATGNVNLDIIYGMVGQNTKNLEEQLSRALSFNTHHISAYQLTIEPNTMFHKIVKNGGVLTTDIHTEADYFDIVRETLVSHGYINYEISNFSKRYKESQHNKHVWNYGDYVGIGAGAHGRVKNSEGKHLATANLKMPEAYMARIKEKGHAKVVESVLGERECAEEKLMMGLRLASGVFLEHHELRHFNQKQLELLQKTGFIRIADNRNLQLTEKGWPLLNSILSEIIS